MSKIYVLDTSAIVDEPTILYSFKDSIIIIPFVVLEELDKLKTFNNDASRNARLAIRFLDQIFEDSNIAHIQSNCKIRIEFDYDNLFDDMSYGDNQIVACAVRIKKTYKKDVTLITSDINLKVKAKSMDLKAESFASTVSIFDMYPYLEMCSDIDLLTKIQLHQQAEDDMGLVNNSFILFEDEYGKSQCLSRKHADGKIKLIKKHNPWGLSCKNKEQSCLVDLIMDKNVSLVTAMGVAGSGKSLLAIACALELVLEQKKYDKIIIYRPIQETGESIGYLPGSQEEKLAPYFTAVMDSFEFLLAHKNPDWKRTLDMYVSKGKIELDSMTFIRGRSIPNTLIILDECQNVAEKDVKTFLTRIGEGSKVVILGDIEQIDSDRLNIVNNGLSKVMQKFKGSELYGHVTLTKGERSKLAAEAAKLL
jgi:PhoH-like ATPase